MKNRICGTGVLIFLISGCFFIGLWAFQELEIQRPRLESNRIYWLEVNADSHWMSTGYDVEKGDIIDFNAEGTISLQQGNPKAYCDPDGYNLMTMQQPITDQNLGALIGRVVLLISIEEDEETGEEVRNEIIKEFYIGKRNQIMMPIGGELQLGINELVVEDNEGSFQVKMRSIDERSLIQ
ncbi:MAG: hypothetical protein GF421_04135 [Candidatus Aminicenantes bacterium]|nr:hypothetical protein [Candidatus Aminicenantes bacterium]